MLYYVLLVLALVVAYWIYKQFFAAIEMPEATDLSISSNPMLSKSFSSTLNARKGTTTKNIGDLQQKVLVLFGSQTGTAEDFATQWADEAAKYKFDAKVLDIEEFDKDDLAEEEFVVFAVSTYGEGEPTDNAKEFYDWIMDEGCDADLSGVKFTVFGLGNKTYEHYNEIGKVFDRRMEELGAKRVYEMGLGDDDSSLEEDFAHWKKGCWPALVKEFGIDVEGIAIDDKPTRKTRLVTFKSRPLRKATSFGAGSYQFKERKSYDLKHPYITKVLVNRELHTEKSDRSCRHIEIALSDALPYQPGDHLGIYPKNSTDVVEAYAEFIDLDLDRFFALVPIDGPDDAVPILGPCTVREALSQHWDLLTPPRKSVLRHLIEYATDASEKAKLETLVADSDAGKDLYNKFIKKDHRCMLDILREFKSLKVPTDHLLEILPKLQVRYYSISSSPNKEKNVVSITAVVNDFVTGNGRLHKGVCTNWLKERMPDSEDNAIPCYVRESHFRLPRDPTKPVIMVGPGTGLAPFRGFLQERQHLKDNGADIGKAVLYFGCRSREIDCLYEDELLEYCRTGVISSIHFAFSREQTKKVYVQEKLAENIDETWTLLNDEGGTFYICGDANRMAPDVMKVLEDMIQTKGNMNQTAAQSYIARLKKENRLQEDVWF